MDDSLGSGSDGESITAQRVLKTLESAWLNEKFSPELLPSQYEYVDCMIEQIQEMEDNLLKLKRTDFRVEVHNMELARIRYVLSSYLRTRLEKIEQNTAYVLEEDEKRDIDNPLMSQNERQYAKDFFALQKSHFQQLILKNMTQNFKDIKLLMQELTPNLSSHVFLKANKSIAGVVIDGDRENRDEEIDLDENSQHIIQYKFVANYVKDNSVQLI